MGFLRRFSGNSLARKLVVLLAVVALVPLALQAGRVARELARSSAAAVDAQVEADTQAAASMLAACLQAANLFATELASHATRDGIAGLRGATAASGMFLRALVGEAGADANSPLAMLPTPRAWPAGDAAQGVLMRRSPRGDLGSVYIVRAACTSRPATRSSISNSRHAGSGRASAAATRSSSSPTAGA
ncbi:MAG: hypothetical protein U1F11_03290 [Steroidobacteraceae bacterium]